MAEMIMPLQLPPPTAVWQTGGASAEAFPSLPSQPVPAAHNPPNGLYDGLKAGSENERAAGQGTSTQDMQHQHAREAAARGERQREGQQIVSSEKVNSKHVM